MKLFKKMFCVFVSALFLSNSVVTPLLVYGETNQSVIESYDSSQKNEQEDALTTSENETEDTSNSGDADLADISNYLNRNITIAATANDKQLTMKDENNISLEEANDINQQIYVIKETSDGWYTIQNEEGTKFLSAKEEGNLEYSVVYIDKFSNDNQKWRFINDQNGNISIQSKKTTNYLVVTDTNEVKLGQKTENQGKSWRFNLINQVRQFSSTSTNELSVADGVYQIKSSGLDLYLSIGELSKNPGRQLLVATENYSQGAKFSITKGSDGWYTLTNVYSSLALDVFDGSSLSGTPIKQYASNQTNAQKFRFLDAGNGEVIIESKLGTVLERAGGNQNENTPIQTFAFNDTIAQKWELIADRIQNEVNVEEGIYTIGSTGTLKNMALYNTSTDNGISLVINQSTSHDVQSFSIKKEVDGWYKIINQFSKKALEVENNDPGSGKKVQQNVSNDNDEQKFKFVDAGDGSVYILTKAGTVLERSGGRQDNKTPVQTYRLNYTAGQKWTLSHSESLDSLSVADGIYQIKSSSVNLYLSIGELLKNPGRQLLVATESYSQGAKFSITKGSDGWYTLTNVYSLLALDVFDGSSLSGTPIKQYASNQTDAQKFRFLDAGNGEVIIESKLGTVLERAGGNQNENTHIQTFAFNNTLAQKWELISDVIQNEVAIEEGLYNIGSTGLSKKLTLGKTSTENGIGFVIKQSNYADVQSFSITKAADGWYTITNQYSKKVLDVEKNNSSSGVKIQQYASNNSDAQKFKFIDAGDGNVYILSKKGTVLERSGGRQDNETPIQTYRLNYTLAQKWTLSTIDNLASVSIADGTYQIKGMNSEKVLSIGALTNSDTSILFSDTTYSKLDSFKFIKQSDGWYTIQNSFSGKVLDVRGGSDENSIIIQQCSSNNTDAQKFKFLDAGNGYVYIQSKLGTVLERPGGASNEGLVIKTFQLNKTAGQKWKIENQSIPSLVTPTSGDKYFFEPGNNSNSVLDVSGGSTSSGAQIQIWKENVVDQQKFIPIDLGNGWYKIESVKSKKVLDISAGSSDARVTVQQYDWNGSDGQQFRFIDAGDGYAYIQSKLGSYLEVAQGASDDGTKIQTYWLNKSAAQKFKLQNISTANSVRTTILSSTQARVTIFNPNNGNVTKVEFPTWSRINDQDDVKWVNGNKNADGSWSVVINSKDYNNGGYFDTHIYATYNNSLIYVGKTSYTLEKAKTTHLFVMGHGATDPGAVGNGTNEREFTRNELLPILKKYAAKLKQTEVIFYDPSRDMYQDSKLLQGAYTVSSNIASVTEVHLDSSTSASSSGGHVIITPGAKTSQNINIASVIRSYVGWNPSYANNQGLSERTDLLNLNVFKSRNIPYRLTELGFISSSKDVANIRNNKEELCKKLIEQVTGETIN